MKMMTVSEARDVIIVTRNGRPVAAIQGIADTHSIFVHPTSTAVARNTTAQLGNVQKQVIHSAGTLALRLNVPKSPPPLTPPRRASEAAPRARGEGNGTALPTVPLPPRGRRRVSDDARRGGEGSGVGGTW